MSLLPQKQITILALSAVLAGFSLASIVNFSDPYASSWAIFLFFYLSLLILCFSLFSLLAFLAKRWLAPSIYLTDFSLSLRQGFLLSLFITASVALQIAGILFWWLELSLLLFLIVLEIFINLKS